MQVSSSPKWISSAMNDMLISQAESLNNNKEVEEVEEKNSQKVDGYNTTSKSYFQLSEDISQYSIANPTQDKIDEDVVSILSKHEDGSFKNYFKFHFHMKADFMIRSKESKEHTLKFVTSESFKHLTKTIVSFDKENRELMNKYGYELSGEVVGLIGGEFTKDEFEEKMNLLYDRFGKERVDNAINDNRAFRIKYNNLFAKFKPKDPKENLTIISENFVHYHLNNEEEMAKFAERDRKGFQNTYRLSDEFAKTEKFNDLYIEHKKESERLAEEARKKGSYSPWDYIFNYDLVEIEKASVLHKGYSKSEWIESIDESKTTLEDLLKDNPEMEERVKVDLKDNIQFYENILTDLKDLWHYGDFKADG